MTVPLRLIVTTTAVTTGTSLWLSADLNAAEPNSKRSYRLSAAGGHELVCEATGTWYLLNPAGKRLFGAAQVAPVTASQTPTQSVDFFGTYRFFRPTATWTGPQGVPECTSPTPDAWVLKWPANSSGDAWILRARTRGSQGFTLEWVAPKNTEALKLQWRVDPSDRLYGFGSRTNACDQRGNTLENWVQEGGNGKSNHPILGISNYPEASHVPVPFMLSSAGFGLRANTNHRSVWDVCTQNPYTLGLTVDDRTLGLNIYPQSTPAQILRALTNDTGRPQMPPLWALGPTEFGKGGEEAVREKAAMLRRERIPASAIWYEDWVGLEHGPLPGLTHLPWGRWVADPTHYPTIAKMNRDLEQQGFKSLGYFNPFVSYADPHARELLEQGLTLRDAKGQPRWFLGPFGWLGHLDLTHPEAQKWAHARLKAFEALGFDGAMVDFGEWTPRDARFHDGSTGETMHNRYPDEWAKLHHDFWKKTRPNGDFVMYTRAGYQYAARHTTYMWAGDQNTNWEKDDGFPTALTAILSAGLSGIPMMTHDIAGFATLGNQGVTKELYLRWLAFGAFSTFMRTHSGQKYSLNWRIDSDAETLALHRHYATEHMRLVPYRQASVKQACDSGMPVMRHLYLCFPDFKPGAGIDDAYMLGDSLLVAPVLTPGTAKREIWLPPGLWYDYWRNSAIQGDRRVSVDAPFDKLPIFVKAGSLIPLLPTGIQSLVPLHQKNANRPFYTPDTLDLTLYAGRPGSITLADGTRLRHWPPDANQGVYPNVSALGRLNALPGRVTRHVWQLRDGQWTIEVDNPGPTAFNLNITGVRD